MYCPGAGIWPSGPGNEAVSGSITALSGPSRPLDGAMMCPDGVLGDRRGPTARDRRRGPFRVQIRRNLNVCGYLSGCKPDLMTFSACHVRAGTRSLNLIGGQILIRADLIRGIIVPRTPP